jgi:acetoin:2,6-dichlorophenolindophenol oxidoreductase subunit alpha
LLYEVMNMASLWSLPVIYVCENNLYNEYTHYHETTAGEILDRPRAFAIYAESVNGQDVENVHSATRRLVQRSRDGLGPAFLQCDTYRFHGHYVGDVDRTYYRSKEEEQDWISKRDPISMLAARIIELRILEQRQLDEIREEARQEIAAGVEFALNCPFPAETEVDENVYS